MRRAERPFLKLPRLLLVGFLVIFLIQVALHHNRQLSLDVEYQPLSRPLSASTYGGIAMGSEQLLSYLLAIRLQLHDNQAGRHFRYSLIDYDVLVEWLERISSLNPDSEYPMLLASRVYSQTRDHDRLRQMLGFIGREFERDPQLHWRRMAEASVIAKHQIGDLELALAMAQSLAEQPASVIMPHWARDIRFLLLADLNEFESAISIIQALLHSNSIEDQDERRFLQEKLLDFQQKLFESQQNSKN